MCEVCFVGSFGSSSSGTGCHQKTRRKACEWTSVFSWLLPVTSPSRTGTLTTMPMAGDGVDTIVEGSFDLFCGHALCKPTARRSEMCSVSGFLQT